MARKWLLLASVVTGVSFSLSFLTTKDWKQALSTGMITLGSVAVAAAVDQRQVLRSPPSWGRVVRPRPTLSFNAQSARATVSEGEHPGLLEHPPVQVAVFWDYENVKVPAQGGGASLRSH